MYEVRVINRITAKPFIEKHHYTKSIGKVSLAFGLFDSDIVVERGMLVVPKLLGVITYGQVSSRDLASSIFEEGTQYNTWEFLRMAVLDEVDYPRTKFISQTIKHIKKFCPRIKALVSFADQTEGHFGYVYQAANWMYCGTTGEKYHYVVGGKRVNKRMAFDKAKADGISEADFVKREGWERVKELPKFRYVYILDKRVIPKLNCEPYPKKINQEDNQ